MYNILSVLIGAIIAIMIAINGQLTNFHGIFIAAVIIHIVGSIFAYATLKITRQNIRLTKTIPLWFYLGGALGVITTFCNNLAFGKISLTSIVALVLLGQTIASLFIDSFGLFGMKKYPFQKYSLIGLSLAVAGIIFMLDAPSTSGIIAMILSFIAGITVVLSRTCNAKLAEKIGILQGSLMNHLIGLPFCVVILFLFEGNIFKNNFTFSSSPWIYFGGVFGVIAVLLFNLLVPKVAALPLTILSFVGQLFTSMILDFILLHTYDSTTFFAGLLIALGIVINTVLDNKYRR